MRRTRPRRWMRLVYFVADPIKGSCHIYGARIFFQMNLNSENLNRFVFVLYPCVVILCVVILCMSFKFYSNF